MRKLIFLFVAALAAAGITGCTGPEQKLSRGIDNTMEVVRWGDMRHSIEQEAVFSSPDVSYTYGAVSGFDKSVSRIGLGLYEIVTFPIPAYHPICTNYLSVAPEYPDSYKPGLISDSTFQTDTYTGYGGGDIAPFVPGSRFTVFGN